jgi:L-fucose dehydrogenase
LDRDQENTLRVEQQIKQAGGQVYAIITELTDDASCGRAIQRVLDQLGRIDGLVNNAGLNDGVGLEKGDYGLFVDSLKRNVGHYYSIAHLALPWLKQSRGAVVNISSKVAETGQGGTSGYAAANGIRNELTAEWSEELARHGIRVNSVVVAECMTPQYQWWIHRQEDPDRKLLEITSRIPLENRMTTPKEIADMVAFLLSPKSWGINGQLIHVDGGYVHLDRRLN